MTARDAASNVQAHRWREVALGLLLFSFVCAVYVSRLDTVTLTDTAFTLPIALSLVREGNVDLNEYTYAQGMEIDGHLLSFFPLGTPILVAPMAFVADQVFARLGRMDLYEYLKTHPDWTLLGRLHTVMASVLTALTTLVIYAIGRLTLNRPRSLLLALLFAFCTSAWSTASRDLWSHTSSILFLSVALYLFMAAEHRPQWVQFAGIPLALAYVMRPTNSLSVVLLTAYVALVHRRYLLRYGLWAAAVAVPFLVFNLAVFGELLPPYYNPQRLANNPDFLEALAANLVSPSRGLLVYAPLFLFVVYSVVLKRRQAGLSELDGFILAILVLHWLTISSFKHWNAGAAYGPRFFVDVLPYLMYWLIPVVDALTTPRNAGQWAFGLTFAVAVAFGLFANYRGATQRATWQWSMAYRHVVDSVDDAPERVWDWTDPQFWRGLRPPRLGVVPAALCLVVTPQTAGQATGQLTLTNRGDRPLTWSAETPRRVFLQPADPRIPGLGYGELTVTADGVGFGPGLHSLGAVHLNARASDGDRPVASSPALLPVTLHVLADGAAVAAPSTSACLAPPPDIWIDGRRQSAEEPPRGLHGPGWYDLETYGDVSFRWASSPAQLYLFSPSAQAVELATTAIALHDAGSEQGLGSRGVLEISVNGGEARSEELSVGEPFKTRLDLQPGWNTVTLALAAGNFRPIDVQPSTGDQRLLSFALSPIDVKTANPQ